MLISCSIVSVIETLLTFCNVTPSSRGESICATFGCTSYSYCTEKEERCQEESRLLRKKWTTSATAGCKSQNETGGFHNNSSGGQALWKSLPTRRIVVFLPENNVGIHTLQPPTRNFM